MIMWSGETPTTRLQRSPDVPTPHNAALHMSPKMWISTSWDGSGLWVCAKRLEKGRFHWPAAQPVRSVTMRAEELAMLVNGLDFKQTEARNWYRRPA
jgi:transposase